MVVDQRGRQIEPIARMVALAREIFETPDIVPLISKVAATNAPQGLQLWRT
jgi:hypothetical protein